MSLNEINEGKPVAEEKEEVRKLAVGGNGRGSSRAGCPAGTHWDEDERKCMVNERVYAKSGGRAKSIARSAPSRAPAQQRSQGGPISRPAPAPRTISGGSRGGGLR